MKTKALIIFSALIILELLYYVVYQLVMGEPYINAYFLIPVFFTLTEGAFVGMSSVTGWAGSGVGCSVVVPSVGWAGSATMGLRLTPGTSPLEMA